MTVEFRSDGEDRELGTGEQLLWVLITFLAGVTLARAGYDMAWWIDRLTEAGQWLQGVPI